MKASVAVMLAARSAWRGGSARGSGPRRGPRHGGDPNVALALRLHGVERAPVTGEGELLLEVLAAMELPDFARLEVRQEPRVPAGENEPAPVERPRGEGSRVRDHPVSAARRIVDHEARGNAVRPQP